MRLVFKVICMQTRSMFDLHMKQYYLYTHQTTNDKKYKACFESQSVIVVNFYFSCNQNCKYLLPAFHVWKFLRKWLHLSYLTWRIWYRKFVNFTLYIIVDSIWWACTWPCFWKFCTLYSECWWFSQSWSLHLV